MGKHIKAQLSAKDSWIELFPYGVTFAADRRRPVMLFKDSTEKQTLPVWLSPLDAGIALHQADMLGHTASPHGLALKILDELGFSLKKCFFKELKGHHQYVELHFVDFDEQVKAISHRADEAVSFCLDAKAKFYCRAEFIEQCRVIDGEMNDSASVEIENIVGPNGQHTYLN